MPEKIRLNLDYACHATVLTDFLVILRTLAALPTTFPAGQKRVLSREPRHTRAHAGTGRSIPR